MSFHEEVIFNAIENNSMTPDFKLYITELYKNAGYEISADYPIENLLFERMPRCFVESIKLHTQQEVDGS